ncbi:hypothetical protein DFQ27_009278 [Actinomortierella ambigua]|uniref:oligopeptidase A n=1 Tax=Actinomortierella ambigua TaxID=1343610 RepID=A0A9P6PNG5_9FUNG|nr:hypothetical protein DFQ27_009278 [Actinomortierella ambigua]
MARNHPLRVVSVGPLTIRRALATITNTPTRAASTASRDPEFESNPILNWTKFPNYSAVQDDHVVPAVQALVKEIETKFLERSKHFEPSWEGTLGKIQDLEDDLERASGLITHLSMVRDSPKLREALAEIQPMIVRVSLLMGQSLELYDALNQLKSNPDSWAKLDKEQQHIVDKTLQGLELSGVAFGLPGEGNAEKKATFNKLQEEKAQLSLKFGNNVQDATRAFAHLIHDKAELDGCPKSLLTAMAQNAKKRGLGDGNAESGPWAVTLDAPTYVPFMMNCKKRDLRQMVYMAYVTRASSGNLDNELIINNILLCRDQEAKMLGFNNYGELATSRMATSVPMASKMLEELYEATAPAAQKELAELTEFANRQLKHPTPLRPWDTAYVGEEFSKNRLRYSADQISEYLVFPRVMQTMFDVAKENFSIDVAELSASEIAQEGITTWNKDVKVYKVEEADAKGSKKLLAYFLGDFYSRSEEKKSGAWMDICVTRMKDTHAPEARVPIAYMICNQPPPTSESEPSRMKFQDVTTLFHEFGHCLQHMLTKVDYPQASGIKGVEWTFVEIASQFMENFTFEDKWLNMMGRHYKTGSPMPEDMKTSIQMSRTCLAGMAMMRQLHFSMLDLKLHTDYIPQDVISDETTRVYDMDAELAKKTCLVPRLEEDRFLCGFSHIFAGGYAAAYYSYKFSEIYSSDAYAALEEAAKVSPEERSKVGARYRNTVLALGGATHPRDVYTLFRGRPDAKPEHLLRHSGLLSTPSTSQHTSP